MAQADPQNILVIHFGQLGDVVLGLPALKAIRERFAFSRITILSGRSTAGLIELASVADDQISVDRVAMRDGNKLRSVRDILKLVKDVRGRKFDLVIDLHSLYETNLLGYASGAEQRLYANRDRRSIDRLSNFPAKPAPEDRTEHHTDRYLKVIEALGITNVSKSIKLRIPAASAAAADEILLKTGSTAKKLIGLFLGAGHRSRRWPIEKFVKAAADLSSDEGTKVIVLLGPEEREIRQGLEQMFGSSAVVIGEVDLPTFFAILARVDVLVSGDTGPMHLAAVAGAGIVLLSQPGSPDIFRPLAENLVVLETTPLEDVSPETVTEAVRSLLSAR